MRSLSHWGLGKARLVSVTLYNGRYFIHLVENTFPIGIPLHFFMYIVIPSLISFTDTFAAELEHVP